MCGRFSHWLEILSTYGRHGETYLLSLHGIGMFLHVDGHYLQCHIDRSVRGYLNLFGGISNLKINFLNKFKKGLRLNVSFDFLKKLRRIFGIGFFLDLTSSNKENFNDLNEILFSSKRIIFSLIKSLPHFFCLSYVTVRLTRALIRACLRKLKTYRESPDEKTMSLMYEYYYSSSNCNRQKHYLNSTAVSLSGVVTNLIYTRKDLNKIDEKVTLQWRYKKF